MTNPVNILQQAGYCVTWTTNEPPRPPTPRPQDDDDDAPSPYCYHLIIAPAHEREAIKEKFMHACNARRWQHVYQSEIKVKK